MSTAKREAREKAGIAEPDERWLQLDAIASIPRDAFPGAPWPEHVHVIPEYTFTVQGTSVDFRLSHEHEHYEWLTYERAAAVLTWDSNRVVLHELNRRLQIPTQQDAAIDSALQHP